MGFVGGCDNIAISTALPPSFIVLYCKHQTVWSINSSYCFIFAWGFGFWIGRLTLAHGVLFLHGCRILCNNMRGLTGNLSDLTMVSSQYDILLCSETLVSDISHVSELRHGSRNWSSCLVVPEQDASGPRDDSIRTRWLRIANRNLSVVVRQNVYVFSLCWNSDLDDRIFTVY